MTRPIKFRAWDIETKSWYGNMWSWRVCYLNGDEEGNQDGDLVRDFEIIGNVHENPELMESK